MLRIVMWMTTFLEVIEMLRIPVLLRTSFSGDRLL